MKIENHSLGSQSDIYVTHTYVYAASFLSSKKEPPPQLAAIAVQIVHHFPFKIILIYAVKRSSFQSTSNVDKCGCRGACLSVTLNFS